MASSKNKQPAPKACPSRTLDTSSDIRTYLAEYQSESDRVHMSGMRKLYGCENKIGRLLHDGP